jgi:hypothetical protein
MKHLRHTEHRSIDGTDAAWLPVGRSIGQVANEWAERSDIVAFVGKGAGDGFPACFHPMLAEIEVNTAVAFGSTVTPEMVGDFTQRSKQYEFPIAMGAVVHESFHARYSLFSLEEAAKVLKADEHHALILLEESRIEALGIAQTPKARPFVRSSAMEFIVNDTADLFDSGASVEWAANLVALVHGRVLAGVLEAHEVRSITKKVEAFLSDEMVDKMLTIIEKAQAHITHRYPEPLYDLAREWAALVREKQEEVGEQPSGSGGSGEGDGEMSDEMSEMLSEMLEALDESAGNIEDATYDELAEQERKEEWDERVKERAKESKSKESRRDHARKVFSKSTGPSSGDGTRSELRESRPPTSAERVAAVTIGKALERAKYRERSEVEVTSVTPPGRLRTRAVVQRAAMEARGVRAEVEPWRRTMRKHTDDPTLTVGVMVDISGSMSAAMEPMATTAWVLSESVRRVQGRAAMVYYGNSVFPTLKAGESLSQVSVYSAPDMTEVFDEAFQALDGSLDLIDGTGARLLVVVSDGCYTGPQTEKAMEWLQRCHRAGVGVLWLPFTSHIGYAERIVGKHGTVLGGTLDPTSAAASIGKAATDALTRAGGHG